MSELSSLVLGILGTVIAALAVLLIKGFLWMRNAITDQKAEHNLMAQRTEFLEVRIDKIEVDHSSQYAEISDKMDQTLAVLTDIKLAFSEVRIKNETNEKRIDRMEDKA